MTVGPSPKSCRHRSRKPASTSSIRAASICRRATTRRKSRSSNRRIAEIVFTVIPGTGFHRVLESMRPAGLQAEGRHRRQGRRIPAGHVSVQGRARSTSSTEVWWSTLSSLFVEPDQARVPAELADAYEKEAKQQASMALGFRHSLLEVPISALKVTQKLDDPASIRNAIRDSCLRRPSSDRSISRKAPSPIPARRSWSPANGARARNGQSSWSSSITAVAERSGGRQAGSNDGLLIASSLGCVRGRSDA